jgi:hypothetical protein
MIGERPGIVRFIAESASVSVGFPHIIISLPDYLRISEAFG